MNSVLVIGYGNELRGDDAVGPQAASTVASWNLPAVRVLICHQLTPDLADPISQSERVIFVDAAEMPAETSIRLTEVFPRENSTAFGHTSHPEKLLQMAATLFGHCPKAFLLAIPARNFELGDKLSDCARNGLADALLELRRLCV